MKIFNKKHLVVFRQPFLNLILEGKKTVESRFSQRKIAPYGQVSRGDVVLMKKTGGDILGEFSVRNFLEFEGLNPTKLQEIKVKYGKEIGANDDLCFWEKYSKAKFATLIFIEKVERYLIPLSFLKKDQRSWIVLWN